MSPTITFAWSGLPDYAIGCLAALIADRPQGAVQVIATPPAVPIKPCHTIAGIRVHWISASDRAMSWDRLGLPVPDLFIQSGYSRPAFNRLGAQCRRSGGRVAMMTDHNWLGGPRQAIIDRGRHRWNYRSRFDAVLVPGRAGRLYHEKMGYADNRIFEGFYGADPATFNVGLPLIERPKSLVFVGQLIARKNIDRLARVFARLSARHPDWRLHVFGHGPRRDHIRSHSAIIIHPFAQPDDLAAHMRRARALVLPSLDEHWGVVVHEAALCGCALALSDVVGAGEDLAVAENAVRFAPRDEAAMEAALGRLMEWDDDRWRRAQDRSLQLASGFGPERFVRAVGNLERVCLASASAPFEVA